MMSLELEQIEAERQMIWEDMHLIDNLLGIKSEGITKRGEFITHILIKAQPRTIVHLIAKEDTMIQLIAKDVCMEITICHLSGDHDITDSQGGFVWRVQSTRYQAYIIQLMDKEEFTKEYSYFLSSCQDMIEDIVKIVNGALHSFLEAYPQNPNFDTDEAAFINNLITLLEMASENMEIVNFTGITKYYLALIMEYAKLIPTIPLQGLSMRQHMMKTISHMVHASERLPNSFKMRHELYDCLEHVLTKDNDEVMIKEALSVLIRVVPQVPDVRILEQLKDWTNQETLKHQLSHKNKEVKSLAEKAVKVIPHTINRLAEAGIV
ncbi:unnamed protein product [Timema podura]|uniref:Uncharacterized protein n=1 Tax=Timema podura TaxID=61482 RepID=A0ABN7PDM5_TIMPD|nr:unnamed protein product [Timema podura]